MFLFVGLFQWMLDVIEYISVVATNLKRKKVNTYFWQSSLDRYIDKVRAMEPMRQDGSTKEKKKTDDSFLFSFLIYLFALCCSIVRKMSL